MASGRLKYFRIRRQNTYDRLMDIKQVLDAEQVAFVLNNDWGTRKSQRGDNFVIEGVSWKIVYMDEREFTLMGDYREFIKTFEQEK